MRAVFVLLLVALVAADIAPLLHADGPKVIPGSYIVILKDGLSVYDRDAHISNLTEAIISTKADAEIGFKYGSALLGFSARLNEDLLKAELAHPDVKYIEADQVMSISYEVEKGERSPLEIITQTGATWGISRIAQRYLPQNNYYAYPADGGKGTDVYVIDTGVLITHNDFGGRAFLGYNAVTNEANNDLNGHGTHCAGTIGGTIYGVAKLVNITAVKVLGASGSGTVAGVAAGCDWVSANHKPARPSIASMSLGGGVSSVMDDAVTNSIKQGVVYTLAAGNNNGDTCSFSPARVGGNRGNAISVGATQQGDSRASYSNYGPCTDVFAPGTSITSDWIGSNTATNTISGTSMATPHVAGALAVKLSLSTTTDDPIACKKWIQQSSTQGVVTNPGTGSPNLFLFSDPAQE